METGTSYAVAPLRAAHVVVGAAQGVAGWLLYRSASEWRWALEYPSLFLALAGFTLAAPLAWYLGHGTRDSERTRALVALALGGAFGALAYHAGSVTVAGSRALLDYLFAAAPLGFVVTTLAGAWDRDRGGFEYPRLFALAWRNAMLAATAAGLTAALWVLLFAGGWLMQSIGVGGLRELYEKPGFFLPVTGGALGLACALVLGRGQTLFTMRRLELSLLVWFLPLTMAFALAWIAALPFTGVEPLFSTRNAAFFLLWFGTLAVLFVNAAYQDGETPPPYPPWLASALQWAWLALPVVSVLAGWALWQRIAQHGWTPDRIWGVLVWLLVSLHIFGYALSIARRDRWMRMLPATNIAAALIEVVAITALISPIADIHRLTVASQLSRLRTGAVDASRFDWRLLLEETGTYGRDALTALASGDGAVATRAADVIAKGAATQEAMNAAMDPAKLLEWMRVKPAGAIPDRALIEWLARPKAGWEARGCVTAGERCILWLVDLDRDGTAEAVMIWQRDSTANAVVYARGHDGWAKLGVLFPSQPLAKWTAEIDAGRIGFTPPRWPDVEIGGQRLTLRP